MTPQVMPTTPDPTAQAAAEAQLDALTQQANPLDALRSAVDEAVADGNPGANRGYVGGDTPQLSAATMNDEPPSIDPFATSSLPSSAPTTIPAPDNFGQIPADPTLTAPLPPVPDFSLPLPPPPVPPNPSIPDMGVLPDVQPLTAAEAPLSNFATVPSTEPEPLPAPSPMVDPTVMAPASTIDQTPAPDLSSMIGEVPGTAPAPDALFPAAAAPDPNDPAQFQIPS
jgi:hypothetical protein